MTETKAKVTRSKQRLALLRRLHKKLYRRQRPWTYADYVFLGYLFFGMRLEEVTISRMLNRTPDQVHRALQRMAHMNLGKEKQCSDKEERKNAKKQVP